MAASLNEMVAEAKREIEVIPVEEAATRQKQRLSSTSGSRASSRGAIFPARCSSRAGCSRSGRTRSIRSARLRSRIATRPVITYCTGGSGARSALAAQTLKRMGFTNVACLDGGLDAWSAAGKPVESD
jgi:rhodanese-related sulfurtransferase